MAYLNTIGCGEGLSSSRPPLFDGTNFATWKTRFRIYARSQGVKVWMAIEDGIIIPTKIIDDVIFEKKVSEYTHEEEDRMNIAAKGEMVLTSALAEKEYKRVNNCKSAKEMWNKLVVTYEGTTDIKDSRMDTLIMEYENFKLQEGENIIDMETRFTRIVDELAQLGKNYTQNEKNRREDNVPDIVVPKVEEKKKNMALKAILIDDDDNDEELNEELKNLDESEIALLTRQLRRVLQSKAQRYGKGFQNQTINKEFSTQMEGQITLKIMLLTTRLAKGRVLVAENGWDLSEDEETSEASEEIVNLCLMASDDASTSSEDFSIDQEVCGPSRVLNYLHLFNVSNLSLLDMSKDDLMALVMELNRQLCDVNQRFLTLWSEHEKLKNSRNDQQKELTRMKESMIVCEDEINSLTNQTDLLKLEYNKCKDNFINLEVENMSLVLQAKELENEKLQLNDNNCKLHVDILNLKIQNESLNQDKSTPSQQKNSPDEENLLLETRRLKDENFKLLSQVKDQEKSLNLKIDSLIKEKENLEIVVQRFTNGNETKQNGILKDVL
nr:PREDICTED: spindle pole body component 110-like [Daucus carota subsp. sativus]